MPTACIDKPHCRIRLDSGRLKVHGPDESGAPGPLLADFPLRDVERLLMHEQSHITTPALAALLQQGVPTAVMGWNGRFLGAFEPPAMAAVDTRRRQYERLNDPAWSTEMARCLADAKLANQLRLLQRAAARRPRLAPGIVDEIQTRRTALATAAGSPEIMGVEGSATVLYWQAWAAFLPDAFPFERRSRRPPHNPVNACLSFASALVYGEILSILHARGLDASVPFLHSPEEGRWSLALDLMEPFRPAIVEPLTLRLFNHAMLSASDFMEKDGGIWLADTGRRAVLTEYERRLTRSFLSEHAGSRTTLRQQFTDTVLSYKAALQDSAAFQPFRLN